MLSRGVTNSVGLAYDRIHIKEATPLKPNCDSFYLLAREPHSRDRLGGESDEVEIEYEICWRLYSMKLNNLMKRLSSAGRWMATAVLCLFAVVSVWQGAFFSSNAAMAAPMNSLIAATNVGDQVQQKTSEDAGRAKGFIRNTADRVEQAARDNASRVDDATDNGSFVERKAKRDAARIHERAEEDAARTQKAVDNTKNAVERAVDNIKDAFN
jgi:hypothetical protein